MKKITLKIIVSIICCSLVISLILCSVAVAQGRAVMQNEVKKELLYASKQYASQFNTEFQAQENAVDLICAMVSSSFTYAEYANNRNKFLEWEKELSEVVQNTMKSVPQTDSLYFTFNPETSGGNDEIWFLRNNNGEVYYKEAEHTVKDWLVKGSESDSYYFKAIEKGMSWSGVEYDKYLYNYSVTYSRSCRDKNGKLVGVMGSDIFIDDIFSTVKNIKLEEGGYAFLLDKNYSYLAGSETKKNFLAMNMTGIMISTNNSLKDDQEIRYVTLDGERYFIACAGISNGWILVLVQSEKTLLQPIQHVKQILFSMASLIFLGVLAYSYYFFKKSITPLVREFEMKDIIILHQSRQAKLGEMVGNIAHQWKQPLNVMSIMLSNLWDDYTCGLLTEKQLKAHVEDMRSLIRNMSSTVDDFADFLKPARKKEDFSIEGAIDTALGLMQESIKINRITVLKDMGGDFIVSGYRNEFCQGVFNILSNARDAIIESNPEKREIRIKIDSAKAENVIIEIENNGNQILKEVLPNLFQPYFTTKEGKGGTGIGLYQTKDIMEGHFNGSIQLFNMEDGVCCRIIIPGRRKNE